MNEVSKIYKNKIGISFRWKYIHHSLVQIVFKDMGFYLTTAEIETFINKVIEAKKQGKCITCKYKKQCKSILLQTPSKKISLAVSFNELNQIEDLLKGTYFQLHLNNYLEKLCKN